MNNKCIYYVEGPCEQQLIAALKEAPERLIPGKIKVFNVVQNLIPKSQMLSIQAGTIVVPCLSVISLSLIHISEPTRH